MPMNFFQDWSWSGTSFGGPLFALFGPAVLLVLMILFGVWSLAWKGLALWKAAKLGHKKWFVALLLINTLGILDIFYIYYFSQKKS